VKPHSDGRRSKEYLLDTSALLTLRDDEAGAERVAEVLQQAAEGQVRCHAAFISRMELLYRIWRDEGQERAQLAYEQCMSLPLNWVEFDESVLQQAAALKAQHPLSLADAWVAASALHTRAVLMHKDPEFQGLSVPQELLPPKATSLKRPRRSPRP
jgi:ribonuclease VapC